MSEIYLDNAATTRPWSEVVEAVAEAMQDRFGNASSIHRRGLAAARIVLDAEQAVADVVGSGPWRVVFTSGGSESNTTAILGAAPRGRRDLVVTTTLEHASINQACERLRSAGGRYVSVSGGYRGVVEPAAIAGALDAQAAIVSVCHVAGELGTLQPVAEVARLVKSRNPGSRVHVDAVQALGQIDESDYPSQVDMLSISAHKIHGPQGVGALLLRPGLSLRPLVAGGDQQDGLRPGTLNLPGIAGFAAAARILKRRRGQGVAAMRAHMDRLLGGVVSGLEGVSLLGDPESRAPGIAVVAVDRVKSEVLLHSLEQEGVLASSGAACHARRKEPPLCFREAGLRRSQGAVRLSMSVDTTAEEVDRAIRAFIQAANAVRSGRGSR